MYDFHTDIPSFSVIISWVFLCLFEVWDFHYLFFDYLKINCFIIHGCMDQCSSSINISPSHFNHIYLYRHMVLLCNMYFFLCRCVLNCL